MGKWGKRFLDVRHHIEARLFVTMFCCLYAVMLIFLLIFYSINRAQSKAAMEQAATAMLRQAHARLAATLHEVDELSAFLLSDTDVGQYLFSGRDTPPSLEWFSGYKAALDLMQYYIVGRSHTIVGMGIVKNDLERCYTGTLVAPIYSPLFSPLKDELVLLPRYPYVLRVIGGSQRVVLITQLAEDFWDQVYGQYLPQGHVLRVYDPQGKLIYGSPAYDGSLSPQPDPRHKDARPLDVPPLSGKYWLLSEREERTGIEAMVWISQSAISRSLVSLNRQLSALLVILFFTAALLSRVLSQGITRNVQILKKNAQRIGQRRYDEIQPLNSQDELGELGQTLAELSSRVSGLMGEINRREQRKREMELEILRAQVSPHFLYNSLNTINYLAALQGAENIGRYTTALIDLLQAALQSNPELVSLEQEIAYIRSYHEIMKYRYVFTVALDIDVSPEAREARVIRMLLQPIIENAFIHGIGPQQRDGRIRVDIRVFQEDLLLEVWDNGAGMTQEMIDAALSLSHNRNPLRFSGIGIRNVQDRIRLQFGASFGLTISSMPKAFTKVSIRMPLIRKEADYAETALGG